MTTPDFAKVTVDGTVTYYNDLAAALAAGNVAGGVVELTNNVDLANAAWTPVQNFVGTFDGKGFKIQNLSITQDSGNYCGLFATRSTGSVLKNLTIENVSITATASEYVGGFWGFDNNVVNLVSSNLTVCGTIDIKGKKRVGVICGWLGKHGIIDCHVDGGSAATSTVLASEGQVGGLFGTEASGNHPLFTSYDCSVENITIKATSGVAGGFIGRQFPGANLVNCSIANVIVQGTEATTGALCGEGYGDNEHFFLNCDVENVTLKKADGSAMEFTLLPATGKAMIVGDDVEGDDLVNLAYLVGGTAYNYQLTAGTYYCNDATAVTKLQAELAAGYSLKSTGEKTYEIVQTYGIQFAEMTNGSVETSVTNGIEAATSVTITVKPADGYAIDKLAVTNLTTELEVTVTDNAFAMPESNVKIYATFKENVQPVNPDTPSEPYKDKDAAEAAAKQINDNKETMINTPDGAVAKDYTALFTAVVTSDNRVVVELNEQGTNTLQTSANTLVKTTASLGDSSATSVTITPAVEDIVPGFYYGLGASATVDGTKAVGTGDYGWKQATTSGLGTLSAQKPAGTAGFFQVQISVKQPNN